MSISLVIRGGIVYDGSGTEGQRLDVALSGDRVAAIAEIPADVDAPVLDVGGLAIAPGFINVLSHGWGALQTDPSGASDLLQGVTTEVFGEAFSPGPTAPGFADYFRQWGQSPEVDVDFPRLSDGLSALERSGVTPNVASFVGGHNLRILAAGFEPGRLNPKQLDRARAVLAEEMQDGALGVGTALIYPPGSFADTAELTALASVVAEYGGMYISHLRSEGDQLLESLDELITVARNASVPAEVYHLKAAGRANWPKMRLAIERIEQARSSGLQITADMYPYTAGSTALTATIPPEFHTGGPRVLHERLADRAQRRSMAERMKSPAADWENLYLAAGGGTGIVFFADLPDGTPAHGRSLADVAADLELSEVDAILDIVARYPNIGIVAYFIIDEDNIRLGLRQPWVSLGSDEEAHPLASPWTDKATHPRTYGTFARFLGKYVREDGLLPLPAAIQRLTSLPAANLRLHGRGRLTPGCYADIAIFQPGEIADLATYTDPHRYATGVRHVLVNGEFVVRDGAITGRTPGRRLRRGAQ